MSSILPVYNLHVSWKPNIYHSAFNRKEKERERVKERRWRQGSLNEKVIVKIERGKEEEHFN